MKTLLFSALTFLLTLPGRAQDRIVLLRDTTRLSLSLTGLEQQYPPAFGQFVVKNGGTTSQEGVFSRRGKAFTDARNAVTQQFYQFIEQRKRRLPALGILLQTREFVRPDGTYDRVFCDFSGGDLTDEQEGQLLQLVAEWYGQHPFPLKTPTGFRYESYLMLGVVPPKRIARHGPGLISTLAAAGQTSRPDTVRTLAFNQLNLNTVPEVVYRFPNLEEVDLSRNALHELPARLTADLPKLKRLSLLYNAIPDDSVFFTPNKHLIALNLQGNRLTRVPRQVQNNRRLESLWLGNNKLTRLDVRPLRRLRRLTDLNLYSAGLTQLPKSIGRLKQLRVLDLYYNQFTALPRQIGRMKRLEQLAVSHNDLPALPPSLARLRRLQTLFAHHNRLSQLPTNFERLHSLRVLNISYNWFNVAPAVLASLPALEELDLSNNHLGEFPTLLNTVGTLKRVYLGSNPLFGSEAMSSPYAGQIRQLEANKKEVFY